MAAETANELLHDLVVRHQIGLLRVGGSLANEVIELLDKADRETQRRLRDLLEKIADKDMSTQAGLRRLQQLVDEIAALRQGYHDLIGARLSDAAQEVAEHEATFIATSFYSVTPVELSLVLPEFDLLKTLVETRPFAGKVLSEWVEKIASADIERVTTQTRIGVLSGDPISEIVRRVVGSASVNGTDGATELTRQAAEGLVRTAVNSFANEARAAFARANTDVINKELFVATLDAKTTPICRSLDGNTYPVGEGPIPPLHFRCRSIRMPFLDPRYLTTRPLKGSTEKQLLREFAAEHGLDTPKRRADLPRGYKTKFDEFARARVRQLTGTTPGPISYQEFLQRQPVWFQEDVLGKTKAQLFRKGGLTLDRFVDQRGKELTLGQLAKREAEAFRRAGLDPEQFARRK